MPGSRRLVHKPAAVRDLREIVAFIAEDNPVAAQKLRDQIDRQVGLLAEFPEMGPLAQDEHLRQQGYRLLSVAGYLVFYVVTPEEVLIRRVLHGARLYRHLLEDAPRRDGRVRP